MMLRNLLHDIVRRRLWPVPVLALLVALAAPVLFLKSAPSGAPDATAAAPAPAAAGELPARAQRLLAASTAAAARSAGATGAERDPFAAPSGHGPATAATAGAPATPAGTDTPKPGTSGSASGGGTSTTSDPIPVVIQNPDGSPVTTPSQTGSGSGASAGSVRPASVDVRFGPTAGSRVHRAIPRLRSFYIHGKLAAVFVKYSPSRKAAVFAISPDLLVTGPVKCRRKDGVCRYLDIPAGSFARLSMLTKDRILVSRRLDVARIKLGSSAASTTAVAAKDRSEGTCLLGKLQALKAGGTPIDRDSCER